MGFIEGVAEDVAHGIEGFCFFVFGPSEVRFFVWDDPKFVVGLLLWGSVWRYWLKEENKKNRYALVAKFHWTAILVFGMNLVTLAAIQILGRAGSFGLVAMSYANATLTTKLFPERKEPEAIFKAANIYEDLSCPMRHVVTIFAGQTALAAMLIYSVYANFEMKPDKITYTFWLAAYVAVQMSGQFKRSGDSKLGKTWDLERWRTLSEGNEQVMYRLEGEDWWFTKSEDEMWWRGWMGFCVNTFYRDVVAFITPVLCLESSSGADFSQNCFAVSYITQLDDMKSKEFKVVPRTAANNNMVVLEKRS